MLGDIIWLQIVRPNFRKLSAKHCLKMGVGLSETPTISTKRKNQISGT